MPRLAKKSGVCELNLFERWMSHAEASGAKIRLVESTGGIHFHVSTTTYQHTRAPFDAVDPEWTRTADLQDLDTSAAMAC